MKLWFYNKQTKEFTVMIAHKWFIQIKETKDYYQRGQYLVIKQMDIFEAQQISIIEDEITVKAMKKIVKKKKEHILFGKWLVTINDNPGTFQRGQRDSAKLNNVMRLSSEYGDFITLSSFELDEESYRLSDKTVQMLTRVAKDYYGA